MNDLKNKIKHFSEGDFRAIQPKIRLPETKIIMKIGEGKVYHGEFLIENEEEGDVRGLVYASSFRMHCSEQGFEGHQVKIHFTYDASGMLPGQIEKGYFTIVCSGGEFELPFTAIIEKPYVMTSVGKVQDMESFRRLAEKDYLEAARLFRSRDFYQILKYEEKRWSNLYSNMRKWSLDEQGLEEFLVGTKQKERIFLTLSEETESFFDLQTSKKEAIRITKNTWGYMEVAVEVKGDFLCLVQNRFSTEDFVGNRYQLEYVIESDLLHGGKNYGEIVIRTPYETLTYTVVVSQNPAKSSDRREQAKEWIKLLSSYLQCEAGKAQKEMWIKEAKGYIQRRQQEDSDNDLYLLLQAQLAILEGRKKDAQDNLDQYSYSRFSLSKKFEMDAYYLYLTAVCRAEEAYTKKTVEDIRRMYMKNRESWQILCILVELDEIYQDRQEKLSRLEEQYQKGANSILFYLQAYRCYREQPECIKKLGAFEIRVFSFAAKYGLLSEEVALYIANLATQLKGFDKNIYQILGKAYEQYPDPMILNAVCTMLIKGSRLDGEYFVWYERAVKAGLKIAQLYESYMITIHGKKAKEPLPKSIYLYFLHGSVLDYTKLAVLYANVILHVEETSELYGQYREKMEQFALTQLEKKHITEPLRIIYKRFLNEENLTPKRREALNEICHVYEVIVQSDQMKSVIVINAEGEIANRVSVIDGKAQIHLYSKEDRIVWEGRNGIHYVESVNYESRRLFYDKHYLELCRPDPEQEEEEGYCSRPLTFEEVQDNGLEQYEHEEVFHLCSKKIREDNYAEDDFLTYLTFSLFQEEYYDKAVLTYLANYYCGPTKDMKRLWRVAREYEIQTFQLAERILTQMLFSEQMFGEAEIFLDYYYGKPYYRLKWAYLVYVCREYVTKQREIADEVMEILCMEYHHQSTIPEVCQIAVLQYYADHAWGDVQENMLLTFLRELSIRQIYFPFFLQYRKDWLKELQLYDKTMVAYYAKKKGKVTFRYQLIRDGEEAGEYHSEVLGPVYENVYVKSMILFEGEELRYYFVESGEKSEIRTEKAVCRKVDRQKEIGKYMRINQLIREGQKQELIENFAEEEQMSELLFPIY
ncbi:DUF5717 family protein [Faecalimonas umbilicata]|uniref:DUF5717 family protein n=1 Tax=Faecalimonas umbilicata TaxID=1912855 RepID=UPI0022E649FB|nr:DUF5717 family protein [Faecalimonas umbilicata]